MGSGSMRCVFLLLGTSSLITCIFFYRWYSDVTPRSERPAGGGVGPGEDEDEEEQSIIVSAASRGGEETEEEEEEEEAACSLRRAVRNDPLLRTRFRFSEPVLQWSRSFSRPDWEQLKDREPPYGWGELPVHVVGSALSLLNSSRLFQRRSAGRCVRCAVVGNGGILRGSGQGRSIDSHDLVFRMNGAVIRGFERDVGTKISFYGFTTNTMKNSLLRYRADGFTRIPQSPDIRYVFIPSDLRDYVMMTAAVQGQTVQSGADKGERPWRFFGHRAADSFRMLHPRFISYLTHSFLQSPLLSRARTRQLYMPSTGALMLLTAVHTCDQVSAYGFITSDYASFSDHYYDSRTKPLRFYTNHDLRMERRLWEELDRRRVIRLFQRRGGG